MEEKCEFPTVNAKPEDQKKIFERTKTIAVVGLSPKEFRDSHQVAKYLQGQGYKIIPVYPREETILGEKVYRSLLEIEGPVDMVDVFRRSEDVPEVVDQAIQRKDVKTIWLQLGIVHNQAAEKAAQAGITVVQNRCVMVEHRRLSRT